MKPTKKLFGSAGPTLLLTTAMLMLATFSSSAFSNDQDRRSNSDRFDDRQERIVLRYFKEHMRGQNTLYLKQKLREQYPGINLRQLKLDSVRLVAKTKRGQGTARLVVGTSSSRAKTVYGTPRDFPDRSGSTFDRVNFDSPSRRAARGVWQMKLRGNFKVARVVLFVSQTRGGGRGERVLLKCESTSYRYKECYVGGDILDVRLVDQLSNTDCDEDYNWGYDEDYIWVDEGCRAVFSVTLDNGRGGGRSGSGRSGDGDHDHGDDDYDDGNLGRTIRRGGRS